MSTSNSSQSRSSWFVLLVVLVSAVGDGWSGRPVGILHQLLLLPFTAAFLFAIWQLISVEPRSFPLMAWNPRSGMGIALLFEIVSAMLFLYAAHHFAFLGYALHPFWAGAVFGLACTLLAIVAFRARAGRWWILGATGVACTGWLVLAIASFPLNYLRSDMLPVILWADTNLLHHIDPYVTMHVGNRLYDFPYLPGMIVAYLPIAAMHLDLRFGSLLYDLASAALLFWAARTDKKREVAALIALFLLSPFLQYRHDLYLQPHWFTLVAMFVLMQRRHYAWAAVVCGVSMGIYQFSWIIFPFVLLHALRRRGWLEAAKVVGLSAVGALTIVGPFLASALHRMESNTVGQWGTFGRAIAEPMNLSYWATCVIHPDKLLRLQALLMIVIFAYCFFRNRCTTLVDTMRWAIVALTVFVLLNVIVDGYFYLMLLVLMLVYTCIANGWLSEPGPVELV